MCFPVALLVTLLSVSAQLSMANRCPDFWISFGEDCYRYFGVHTTWQEAEKICTDLGQAHLVSVHCKEEFDFVYQLWKELRDDVPNGDFKMQGLWTGLTDKGNDGTFKYTDGSCMDYDAFGKGEPNNYQGSEEYVHFKDIENKPPFWNDENNEEKFQVMCKQSC